MKEQEGKYFIPDIEDIRVGYECEIEDVIPSENPYSKHIFSSFDSREVKKLISANNIRVPYLSKEQIEAEEWVDTNDRGMSENNGFLFKKDKCLMRYWTAYPRLRIDHQILGPMLETDIIEKISINEFRYICKLLKIHP